MSLILFPLSFLLSILLILTSFVSRLFSIISVAISYALSSCLIKIDSDKFAKFIFSLLSISELTGIINRGKEVEHEQKEIQSK